ncbi:MAG TPA: hypothetical protein VNT54_10990 [Solirubrobacteraceae bacterium]|nr:hypothetical protein [Solirubrobacteraceae bacterium]
MHPRARRPIAKARILAAVLVATAAVAATADAARAAVTVSATVTPATPGTAGAPNPVAVGLRATLTGRSNATPRPIRGLQISLPDGFATTLASIPSCLEPRFAARGAAGCPPQTRLGVGSASFVYVAGGLRLNASTDELMLFHGERRRTTIGHESTLHLYARVTKPIHYVFSIAGRIDDRQPPLGPLVSFDLGDVANPPEGGTVSVTRAAFDVDRGFAAGPCGAGGRWAFGLRLQYVSGAADTPVAHAACGPDATAPVLRASARSGRAALGARLAVRLSEPARIVVALQRRAGTRWRTARRVRFDVPEGFGVLRIRRARGRPLPPGRYRARLQAFDAAGHRSTKRIVTFRLR